MEQAIVHYHRTFSSEDVATAYSALNSIRFLLRGYNLNHHKKCEWEIAGYDRLLEAFADGSSSAADGWSSVATLHYLQQKGRVCCISVVLALSQDLLQVTETILLEELGFLSSPFVPIQATYPDHLFAGFHDLVSPGIDWSTIRLCIDPPSGANPSGGGTAKQ